MGPGEGERARLPSLTNLCRDGITVECRISGVLDSRGLWQSRCMRGQTAGMRILRILRIQRIVPGGARPPRATSPDDSPYERLREAPALGLGWCAVHKVLISARC